MEITIKSRIAVRLRSDVTAYAKLETSWGEDAKEHSYNDVELDLGKLTRSECQKLHDIFKTSGIQGTRVLAADIAKYLRASEEGVDKMTARTVRQAAWMLEFFVAHLPNHMVFSKDDYEGDSYVGYYIEDIDFVERHEYGGRVTPEHVHISRLWIDQDDRSNDSLDLYAEDVLGMKPDEML
ncbi:MAG: hypothetical protein ACRELY_15575, partial [Polyangiaceae bacterium]